MENAKKRINENLCRIMADDPNFKVEMNTVGSLYEFYDSVPENYEEAINDPHADYGQLWKVKNESYMPTRDIRNVVKKLIDKQTRFFLSKEPNLNFKPMDGTQSEQAENKRNFIDNILDTNKFWRKSKNAFHDCVVGKRVLLAVLCPRPQGKGKDTDKDLREIQLKYYTSPEFIYQFKPHNTDELQKVTIAYADDNTVGLLDTDQRWFRWTYEMIQGAEGESCWATFEVLDGQANPIEVDQGGNKVIMKDHWNTQLNRIPCKVILNDAKTSDTKGRSDLLDLVYMAHNYNRTVSDYRDALRFKMFEQPVFSNVDDTCLQNVEIAPGSVISIKPDMSYTGSDGSPMPATATMLSSTFNFADATNSYLDGLKKDMYELMEQPLPEQIQDVPSGKALGMLYNDLISRCEDKWVAWDEAIRWAIDLIISMVNDFKLYTDNPNRSALSTDTLLTIEHNYPIPQDEAEKKDIAIKEVQAKVKSKLTYIKEYGDVEDEVAEYEQILTEMDDENNSMNTGLMEVDPGFDDGDGDEGASKKTTGKKPNGDTKGAK